MKSNDCSDVLLTLFLGCDAYEGHVIESTQTFDRVVVRHLPQDTSSTCTCGYTLTGLSLSDSLSLSLSLSSTRH